MFFNHPEIRAILKEYFSWSEAEMQAMQSQYVEALSKLILDESMLFIEQHALPENDELASMLQQFKVSRGQIGTETKLLQFVGRLPGKYPELEALIKDSISKLDEDLFKDFIDAMDEPTAIKVLTIINSDLTKMEKIKPVFPFKCTHVLICLFLAVCFQNSCP